MQLSIDFASRVSAARSMGAAAGERSADRAQRCDPNFRARALDFIVGYIRQQGEATGEAATAAAVLAGIEPPDQRAFGPVYQSAIRSGLIRVVGYVPRAKGHGSMGGKLYRSGAAG